MEQINNTLNLVQLDREHNKILFDKNKQSMLHLKGYLRVLRNKEVFRLRKASKFYYRKINLNINRLRNRYKLTTPKKIK